MKSSARFIIEHARVTRVNRRDKVTFITHRRHRARERTP